MVLVTCKTAYSIRDSRIFHPFRAINVGCIVYNLINCMVWTYIENTRGKHHTIHINVIHKIIMCSRWLRFCAMSQSHAKHFQLVQTAIGVLFFRYVRNRYFCFLPARCVSVDVNIWYGPYHEAYFSSRKPIRRNVCRTFLSQSCKWLYSIQRKRNRKT